MHVRRQGLGKLLLLLTAAPALIGSLGPRSNFDERLLAAHNRERSVMSVPPLQWDPELAAKSGEWAEHLSRTGKFEHSPDDPEGERIGENIWGGTPDAYQPEMMVGLWIDEKKHYKAGTFPDNSRSGRVEQVAHYTQVIWRSTTHVGCAARRVGGEEVMVCRYRTAGNIYGQSVA